MANLFLICKCYLQLAPTWEYISLWSAVRSSVNPEMAAAEAQKHHFRACQGQQRLISLFIKQSGLLVTPRCSLHGLHFLITCLLILSLIEKIENASCLIP